MSYILSTAGDKQLADEERLLMLGVTKLIHATLIISNMCD